MTTIEICSLDVERTRNESSEEHHSTISKDPAGDEESRESASGMNDSVLSRERERTDLVDQNKLMLRRNALSIKGPIAPAHLASRNAVRRVLSA
jgi:hypothetical protein